MAKCKVVSSPDYELTLTGDEKQMLEKVLYNTCPSDSSNHGVRHQTLLNVYEALYEAKA